MNKWTNLPEDVVEYGEIISKTLFSDDTYTFGKLIVLPHSKIRLHEHKTDCEWYINELTGETFFCPHGQSHEFTNDTEHVVSLLSVKKRAL